MTLTIPKEFNGTESYSVSIQSTNNDGTKHIPPYSITNTLKENPVDPTNKLSAINLIDNPIVSDGAVTSLTNSTSIYDNTDGKRALLPVTGESSSILAGLLGITLISISVILIKLHK
ncbi:LPXTG cell wall anchor domain-containing protein [Lactococcus garvieae]